ncbi:glycine-rich domain-containing protein [Pseudonocardia sp. GCM10023141]|uniref:glycine-rich domain-containing protein n=1 Tax=Pseudonocardia sp. GCM10023141 TaxID=3252653 RepID=UPI003615C75A
MTTIPVEQVIARPTPPPHPALDFEAPYVAEKLLDEHHVASLDEGSALFEEVKRYLFLSQCDPSRSWQMYSLRVDQAWHQFVLFTAQYVRFCMDHFGRYLHHAPSNSPPSADAGPVAVPGAPAGPARPDSTFPEFRQRYEELFGVELPDLWYDHRGLGLHQRLVNQHVDGFTLAAADDMIQIVHPSGRVVLEVDLLAADALLFALRTPAFHVRELGGDLHDQEKVALASALVECRLLRISG